MEMECYMCNKEIPAGVTFFQIAKGSREEGDTYPTDVDEDFNLCLVCGKEHLTFL